MAKKVALSSYMALIMAAGPLLLIILMIFFPVGDKRELIFFLVLAIIAETQTVFLGENKTISVSSAVVTVAMLSCGTGAAVLTAAVCVLGSIAKIDGKTICVFNTKPQITLFNIGNYVIASATMCLIYFGLGGMTADRGITFVSAISGISRCAPQLMAGVIVSILLNSAIVAAYGSIKNGQSFSLLAGPGFIWPIMNVIIISLLGALLTALYVTYGWFLVMLFFIPFILARYTFSTYNDLREGYLQTVGALATAIEAKDVYTSGHSRRVERYCDLIACEMRLPGKRREVLEYAALLHDIGKISVPEDILNKPGRPTPEEWDYIRQHPSQGEHIIKDVQFLKGASDIIRSHHEWYNGKGYPDGKDASQLSLEAMIICVADSYDAMTSDRPYRKRLSQEAALAELHNKSGIQFNPEVVAAFDRLVKRGDIPPDGLNEI